jgi:threonine-phosphate decarboxylase
VALTCLEDPDFSMKTERWLEKEREFMSRKLTALAGLCPLPSQANFLLVKIDQTGLDALQLRSFLARKKILIRACDSFAGLGADYFRVAVKRRRDNLRLLEALGEWTASENK